jgi:hypothetical protein
LSDDNVGDVMYRWHQIMFRLDEMDEIVVTGLTEDESAAFEAEHVELRREVLELETRLGVARVGRLKAAHELDRAYARQAREEEEKGGS